MLETLTQPKIAADYMRLPEGTPIQLIAGEFIMSPSPLTFHQRISMRLSSSLYDFVMKRGLGEVFHAPTDLHVSYKDVYQPDIFFISKEHLIDIEEDGIYGAPDLVIEILSPSTAGYDRGVKMEAYQKFGVKEYWIVDPKETTMEAYANAADSFQTTFSGKEGVLCSTALPEFCVDVQSVFKR
jgi:Uma2 family endonuclease